MSLRAVVTLTLFLAACSKGPTPLTTSPPPTSAPVSAATAATAATVATPADAAVAVAADATPAVEDAAPASPR